MRAVVQLERPTKSAFFAAKPSRMPFRPEIACVCVCVCVCVCERERERERDREKERGWTTWGWCKSKYFKAV